MFLCVISKDGQTLGEWQREHYASRMMARACSQLLTVMDIGPFFGLVAPAVVPMRGLMAQWQGLIGIGNVRLDNRKAIRRWGGRTRLDASDLELVLAAYRERGRPCIRDLLGDFAFVICDPQTGELVAARDAFGVKTLFYGDRADVLVLSSHLELVHLDETIDEEFVADFLLGGNPGPERTIWADSRAVSPGTTFRWREGTITHSSFWNADHFFPSTGGNESELTSAFRHLFEEGVRVRVDACDPVWSELSGGLDSSSVVCTAQHLAREQRVGQGLAGTITVVDELGEGDERRFSDLVVRDLGLRNELVRNPWPWQDNGRHAPATDEPRTHYPYFARDALICTIVREAGAQVLLSGLGSDHYLYANRLFLADLVASGHPIRALKELARWSIAERTSYWTSMGRDAFLPLLPQALQRRFAQPWNRVPSWVTPAFARRVQMADRVESARTLSGHMGSRFARGVHNDIKELTRWLPRGPFEQKMEIRFPFLYRPLVELGLSLPVDMVVRPLAPKWVLRQAMTGVLPEGIRLRQGKGGIGARVLWGLGAERERIRAILNDSMLAELGLIRRDALKTEVDRAERGECEAIVALFSTLSLDTWFFVRSGRWIPHRNEVSTRAARSPSRTEGPIMKGGEH